MTHLILDIGNTRTKVAVMKEGDIVEQCTCPDIMQLNLRSLCTRHSVDKAIASVVGPMPDFRALLPCDVMKKFHLLSHTSRMPIKIDYATPETLGMDRVAAVVGAREQCPGSPLMVVDAGSCITIDLLDDNDCYRGGAILPGLQMRFKAMHHYTAALPEVELTAEELSGETLTPIVGRSTRESLVAGVCNAALFEIQGFAEEYRRQYPDIKLFLTGGNADFFAKRLFFPNFALPSLMLIGLDKLLELNV
ncbi:MAG: type III pantothenate kinase [Bacteroidales bacterium]|nr:type III pantothenate kinase [Bacteroidales bacterium]